jgi:phospholipid/cholesterol/gamma-HCH transport system substrate-binding protein
MKLSKEFKVGLFMVTSIVLLYFGFNFLKGIDFFASNNKYFAIYDNIDKLAPSNQVYLNGVSVGRVNKTIIQQSKNRVIVELDIDSDVILGDSTVAILSGDFFGNKYILLDIGRVKRQLEPKDTLLTGLDKGIAEVLAQAAPVADNLQTTLRKVNTILDNLGNNTQKLDNIFNQLEATPKLLNKTIASVGGNVGEMTGTFQHVGNNLNNTLAELKPAIENFKTLSDSLKLLKLNGTIFKAQQTLGKLNETLGKLNKGDNTVSKLITEDSVYVNLNKLLVNLDSLANHFNQNPRHFMSPLGKSRKKIERELQEQRKKDAEKH